MKAPADKPVNKGGKPRTLTGGQRKNVYFDEPSLIEAKRLGNGDLSKGVRLALQLSARTKASE